MLFFFKQKTAYEMRISDWSSDVCSSDLMPLHCQRQISLALPWNHRQYDMRRVLLIMENRLHGGLISAAGGLILASIQVAIKAWKVARSDVRRVAKECVSTF